MYSVFQSSDVRCDKKLCFQRTATIFFHRHRTAPQTLAPPPHLTAIISTGTAPHRISWLNAFTGYLWVFLEKNLKAKQLIEAILTSTQENHLVCVSFWGSAVCRMSQNPATQHAALVSTLSTVRPVFISQRLGTLDNTFESVAGNDIEWPHISCAQPHKRCR